MSFRSNSINVVVYPESCPNWEEIIEDLKIPAAAILHDRDWNKDGSLKKPHVHISFCVKGQRTRKWWIEVLEPLKTTFFQDTRDKLAFDRYLTHMDNPLKAQYSQEEVKVFYRYSYNPLKLTKTVDEQFELLYLLKDTIATYNITEITSLIEILHQLDYRELNSFVCSHHGLASSLVDSQRYGGNR